MHHLDYMFRNSSSYKNGSIDKANLFSLTEQLVSDMQLSTPLDINSDTVRCALVALRLQDDSLFSKDDLISLLKHIL